ncbi:hypothetical protein LUZ63_023279 [Rhynchospora breviuscula]|uniref:Serine racemase n=1 Tax=Rhynchospora breviuscula TaxID=2022672 RepID=A0A9Q0BY88_9POAL|nr:hypothetical protein LUZ63_023279 [Rhynchospora breviuscula]
MDGAYLSPRGARGGGRCRSCGMGDGGQLRPHAASRGEHRCRRHRSRGVPARRAAGDPGGGARVPRILHPDRGCRRDRRPGGVPRPGVQRPVDRSVDAGGRAGCAAAGGACAPAAADGVGRQGAPPRCRPRRRGRGHDRRHPRRAVRGASGRFRQRRRGLPGLPRVGDRREAAARRSDLEHRSADEEASRVTIPTLAEFEDAAATLRGVVSHTPLEESQHLSDLLGVPVHLKLENLQRTGSFKIRGAAYRLSRLTEQERSRGVVAASAGNHAQGVALAAQKLGIPATIFMPLGVPVPKLLATRGYGAEVVLEGATVETPLRLAAEFAERTGAVLIHPFDHRDIIVGQGTLGLELVHDLPELDTVLVGIGGGGLAAGVAAAVRARTEAEGRRVRIVGVQAANSAAYPDSLAAGIPLDVTTRPTIADGIAVARPGDAPFAIIRELVDEVVTVDEDDIARALLVLLERAKVVVEPAGAVGVAAILAGKVQGTGPTVSILSGGNIDPLLLQRVVAHGLAASDRYMTLKIPLPDRPGQLARVSELLASAGANVIEVLHTRHGQGLQISDVELKLSVETRGAEHSAAVITTLTDAGFHPRIVQD